MIVVLMADPIAVRHVLDQTAWRKYFELGQRDHAIGRRRGLMLERDLAVDLDFEPGKVKFTPVAKGRFEG